MSDAFVGGVTINLGAVGSPTSFSELCEIKDVSGIGKTNSLVDVTSFCSPAGVRQFIAGLAEGNEITMIGNLLTNDTNQDSLMDSVDSGSNREFQIVFDDGSNTITLTFEAVCLSWEMTPSFDDANGVTFGLKVSGDITRS